MMTKDEYIAKDAALDDWAPGWEAIMTEPTLAQPLVDAMRADNPLLVTDMDRKHNYL